MEGALESGERCAEEVAQRLKTENRQPKSKL
jgi:monoamine oxidase